MIFINTIDVHGLLPQGNVIPMTCWKAFASDECLCSNNVSFLKMEVGPGFR